ncbi:MAG: hypothetical protein GY711_35250 [bacterium]|nr:hypothetical protein [bacterium]
MLARSLLLAFAACLVTLGLASVPTAGQSIYVNFTFSASATGPQSPARPVAEGGEDQWIVSLKSRDHGAEGALPRALRQDLRVDFSLSGTAVRGEDYELVDDDGNELVDSFVIPAGKRNFRVRGVFMADVDDDLFEDVVITLDGVTLVQPLESPRAARMVRMGKNTVARWVVVADNEPIIQFSHTSPGTFPRASTKIAAPENVDYWGLRLTDSGRRTSFGSIQGNAVTLDEPLQLTFAVSGTATGAETWAEGVDYLLFDHTARPERSVVPTSLRATEGRGRARGRRNNEVFDGEAGRPASQPLVFGRTVTVTMPAGSTGWAIWAEFFNDPDDRVYETVELQLIGAKRVGSGEPVAIGWNNRAVWIKRD